MRDRPSGGRIRSSRGRYPFALLLLLLGLLLSAFLLAPVTVTLDGYSHLYQAHLLRRMLASDPSTLSDFQYNSPLVPNWLSTILLAMLSTVLPGELALRLFIILIVSGFLASLYLCTAVEACDSRQRAQVLIVLLPLAVNAYVTLGFYGFLASSSLCMGVLALLLRADRRTGWRGAAVIALLLVTAYFFHPLPVMISFLYPLSGAVAARLRRNDSDAAADRTTLRAVWPWLPPAGLLAWFSLHTIHTGKPHPYPPIGNPVRRALQLTTPDALVSISPTPLCGALLIGLIAILAAGVLAPAEVLTARSRFQRRMLAILCALLLILFLLAPEAVGEGRGIASRILLHAALALGIAALGRGVLHDRVRTLGCVIAAASMILFSAEYLSVSHRMAPAVSELRAAMNKLPKSSRILVLAYRLTPSCPRSPLLERVLPERHWAMAAATASGSVVLNDYEAATTVFPLRYANPRFASVTGEFRPTSAKQVAAWSDVLKRGDRDVDFIVSWGVPGADRCPSRTAAPLLELLGIHYERVFAREGSSRVTLWRRRG